MWSLLCTSAPKVKQVIVPYHYNNNVCEISDSKSLKSHLHRSLNNLCEIPCSVHPYGNRFLPIQWKNLGAH